MKFSEKSHMILSKLEIVIATIMFFVMLVSCGLYINIKLNGKISNLPPLSENDTRMLSRSSDADDIAYTEDLLEPLFIGVKNEERLFAVAPSDSYRRSFEELIYDNVALLFGGIAKKMEFASDNERNLYIQNIKDSESYIVVSFYSDVPSEMILPCILNNPDPHSSESAFLFKYLYFLPDSNNNLFACAVSENLDITELHAHENINFDKILNESYDVSEGFVRFGYSSENALEPVYLSSIRTHDYRIESIASIYGKEHDKRWVDNLFDVFSINSNLVKSFTSGDKSEINHVDESKELVINDDGRVVFKSQDFGAVLLDEYLGYIADSETELSFSDKVFVLKKIINRIVDSTYGISYSLSGINFSDDVSKIYFKYMTDGIFLYDTPYDAVFEIKGNKLVYADFKAIKCTPVRVSEKLLLPQKFAGVSDSVSRTYLVLADDEKSGFKSAVWSYMPLNPEVDK